MTGNCELLDVFKQRTLRVLRQKKGYIKQGLALNIAEYYDRGM